MRIASILTALAAAAAVVAGTTAPAGAATQVRTDAADDTSSFFGADPSDTPEDVRDAADIRTLRGVHGDGRLAFTATVADLATPTDSTGGTAVMTVRFATPGGRDYRSTLQLGNDSKSVTLVENESNTRIECDGLEGRAIAKRDQYVIVVPRSCVRNPREVRFGAIVSFFGSVGSSFGEAADDARRDGTLGEQIRLGTRAVRNN